VLLPFPWSEIEEKQTCQGRATLRVKSVKTCEGRAALCEESELINVKEEAFQKTMTKTSDKCMVSLLRFSNQTILNFLFHFM